MKKEEAPNRPLGITIYAVVLIISVLGSILSIGALSESAINLLGARLSGPGLMAYVLFWMVINAILLYGIWKRKEWVPNLAVPVLGTQILLSIGQFFFLEESITLALSQAEVRLNAPQMKQAVEISKTIGMVSTVVMIAINAAFIWVIRKHLGFFTEKGSI